jgi:hypothetical protein
VGCGNVTPVIAQRDDRVVWYDAREYTGYQRSLPADTGGGHRLAMDRLEFDAAQYLTEVERANRDRSWETPEQRTERIARDLLLEHDDAFTSRGYWLGWVRLWPDGDIHVEFMTLTEQVLVTLTPRGAVPEEIAADVLAQLLAIEPTEWERVEHYGPWVSPATAEIEARRNDHEFLRTYRL